MKKEYILILAILFLCPGTTAFGQKTSHISDLLSSEGKIFTNEVPNSVLVIDYPENIKTVENYLEMVDVPPRQVLIEARVVEVRLQGQHALGINWSLFADHQGAQMGQFRLSGATVGSAISQSIDYKATEYPPSGTDATDETPFTLTIFDENINVIIKALANKLDTNVLSAPRVTTINNNEAEIRVVRELRWVEPQVQMTDQNVSITWEEADDSPRKVGIILKVTPMITEEGDIQMELKPEVSEHVSDVELTAISGSTSVPYTIPIVDTRNADTKVVIGNGQTLIIGGLIKETSTKGETKIPVLGDIPVLGHFFKTELNTTNKSELLIFVSPTIITPSVKKAMTRKEKDLWYAENKELLMNIHMPKETIPGPQASQPKAQWTDAKAAVPANIPAERSTEIKSDLPVAANLPEKLTVVNPPPPAENKPAESTRPDEKLSGEKYPEKLPTAEAPVSKKTQRPLKQEPKQQEIRRDKIVDDALNELIRSNTLLTPDQGK